MVQIGVPETTARLARNTGLTLQSVQRVVNEMVADGMLTLKVNPYHKRAKLVLELHGPWVISDLAWELANVIEKM